MEICWQLLYEDCSAFLIITCSSKHLSKIRCLLFLLSLSFSIFKIIRFQHLILNIQNNRLSFLLWLGELSSDLPCPPSGHSCLSSLRCQNDPGTLWNVTTSENFPEIWGNFPWKLRKFPWKCCFEKSCPNALELPRQVSSWESISSRSASAFSASLESCHESPWELGGIWYNTCTLYNEYDNL